MPHVNTSVPLLSVVTPLSVQASKHWKIVWKSLSPECTRGFPGYKWYQWNAKSWSLVLGWFRPLSTQVSEICTSWLALKPYSVYGVLHAGCSEVLPHIFCDYEEGLWLGKAIESGCWDGTVSTYFCACGMDKNAKVNLALTAVYLSNNPKHFGKEAYTWSIRNVPPK